MSSFRGFGKSKTSPKKVLTITNSTSHESPVTVDMTGEFDWVSNIMTRDYRDGNILFLLDDEYELKKFPTSDYTAIVGSINTLDPSWTDAVHCFVEKEHVESVIALLRNMTHGGWVITVIKDQKNKIRLIPSLMRGIGAKLYNQ
jgi:hypothetical protein